MRIRLTRFTWLITAAMFCGSALTGRASVPLEIGEETREARMLADAADGTLDDFSLLEAALLASGVSDVQLERELEHRFDGYREVLRTQTHDTSDDLQRCERAFEFVHQQVLRGEYHADCTQLDRALLAGDYNCVSATILFQLLAHDLDLHTQAVSTPTHVFTRLHLSDHTIDLQTTCSDWFRLSAAQQAKHNLSYYGSAGAAHDGALREISDVQLIGKLYYNRGVRELEAERFEASEQAFQVSLRLDPQDAVARENLLAALNNWALKLSDQRDFEQAMKVLERGIEVDSSYGPLQANDLHIRQKWALELCQQTNYARALQVLAKGRERHPEAALYRDGPLTILRLWATARAEEGDFLGAIQVYQQVDPASVALPHEASYYVIELARHLQLEGNRAQAITLLDEARKSFPQSASLEQARTRLTDGDL